MLSLREYRHRADRLADHLPWAALVAPGVILNKDGSFQRTAHFRGPDLESATEAELVSACARANNVLKRFGTGWALHIEAERREALGYPASYFGDTTSGTGDAKRVHILVKPFAAGLSTNLVITTDRRAYHLQLDSTPSTAMAALSWSYPQDELIAIRRAAERERAAAPVATGLAIEQLYFGYTISGDMPPWRPYRAFDDGRQTYIEFPPSISVGEAPPLFVIGPTGEAQLVNYRVAGRFYIVDRLFDIAELRLGEKRQAIVRIVRGGSDRRQNRRRAS